MNTALIVLGVVAVIFYIAAIIIFAFEFASIAEGKGHSKRKYFWLSLIFGIPAYIVVIVLRDKVLDRNREDTVIMIARISSMMTLRERINK